MPGIYLILTIPVMLSKYVSGPMVTTRITEYRVSGQSGIKDTFIQIGGQIVDQTNNSQPVGSAWVRLEDMSGDQISVFITNTDGRFTFSRLRQGTYMLRVRAEGHTEVVKNIQVPSPTGKYDVVLT